MPDGGTLTLRTEDIDGRLVKLTIEDTGHGIPDNLKERVFEPFFTTRASKGHKGMGLAIVHRVAEEHQGRVHIDPYTGKGATIRLTFPASREALHLV
jgi:signal transduction histidine kinase